MTPHDQQMLQWPDYVLFRHRACHVFALALKAHFGYGLRMLYDPSVSPRDGAVHVYCIFDDSQAVDVGGVRLESEILQPGWELHTKKDIAECDLDSFMTPGPGRGLSSDPDFVREATVRAEKLIQRHREYYSGRLLGPIPEFKDRTVSDGHTVFKR